MKKRGKGSNMGEVSNQQNIVIFSLMEIDGEKKLGYNMGGQRRGKEGSVG